MTEKSLNKELKVIQKYEFFQCWKYTETYTETDARALANAPKAIPAHIWNIYLFNCEHSFMTN